jgi:hypothetical protein
MRCTTELAAVRRYWDDDLGAHPPLVFPAGLSAVVDSGSLSVQFLFTAARGSTFRIDDVEMGPYRRT